VRCAACQEDNPSRAKFCLACGARLAAGCVACGAPGPEGAKFCPGCGRPFEAAEAAPARAPESYTPRHLAEKILTSRASLEGERKPVTVLFCDLVGSTALAERLGPEGMHAVLGAFFDRALVEVHRYEGTINQFLGDGLMALFGAPIAHEDHARRAVLAAMGIRRAFAERPVRLDSGEEVTLTLRMGAHTGFVVVGAIGDNLRMDYTAVGDTTHLAARLQQLAEPGAILISDATARLVEGYALLERLGPTEIRGRAQPVVVHALVGAGSRRSRLDETGRGLSRFVGRDRELAALTDLLGHVEQGSGQVAGIVGEPGVGKSRLILEMRGGVASRSVTYLEGRCLSYGRSIPYLPVLDLLRAGCGILDADDPDRMGVKVRATLGVLGIEAAEREPYLLNLLGVKDLDDRLAALGAEAIMTRTFETLRQMTLLASRQRPLILVVEDLHWIDQTSESYLASLVEGLAGARILLLATYRPGYRPAWMDRSYATQLSIRPLAAGDSLAVVRSLLPDVIDADPRARLILDKAEGNPFFLEELARVVGDDAGPAGGVTVPDTVHGVLMARIDRLPETPKRLLQTASILGREFSVRVLEAMLEEAGALLPHLAELSRLEFLYERTGAEESVYVFKHALTQDVAQATLVASRRRDLHRRAAEALETLYPNRVHELAPVLAHHYGEAEAWAAAVSHATRAAESARAAYANREALARYDQAITAAERAGLGAEPRIRLLEARAGVAAVLGDFERARGDLESALALAEALGAPTVRGRLLWTLGALWGGHKDYQKGIELTRRAVALIESAGDRRAVAEVRAQLGVMQLNLGRMAEGRSELERALILFREIGDEAGQARTLEMLSMSAWMAGAVTDTERYVAEALPRLRALGDRVTEVSALVNLAAVQNSRDGWAAAEPSLRRALELARATGARGAEACVHAVIAECMISFGLYGRATQEARIALEIAREIGHREWMAFALADEGSVLRVCGDAAGARRVHEEMLVIARELGTSLWTADALGNLGEDLLLAGDDEAAARYLAEALAHAGEGMKHAQRPLIAQAELLLRAGRVEDALAAARHAGSVAVEVRVFVAEARRVEGEALAALGRVDEALAILRDAKATTVEIGAAPGRWRICLALSRILGRGGHVVQAAAETAEARALLAAVSVELSDPALRRLFESSDPWREANREGADR
jgi:class 3 adenylate cyclase/tetratricopeptide (TPR) repeat protein